MMRRRIRTASLLACAAFLAAGCSGDMSDLRSYANKVKQRPGEDVPPIPEFEPYQSFAYVPDELRDPFRPQAGFAEPEQPEGQSTSDLKPDTDRRKEPLESFPLDSLDMVGTLQRNGSQWALIRDPDGAVHQVMEGNYLGQNYGRITNVTGANVSLVEIIPDGQGGWMEREAAIGMSDG